jgi:hypothetical protein
MSLEMAHKVILPPKKNYIPQFLKQRDINSYYFQQLITHMYDTRGKADSDYCTISPDSERFRELRQSSLLCPRKAKNFDFDFSTTKQRKIVKPTAHESTYLILLDFKKIFIS